MRGGETARNGVAEARILFVDTTEFFGPVMQVHSQLMKHLDPNSYRIFVATNSRSNSREQLHHLEGVVVKEYYLGGSLRGRPNLWHKTLQLLANLPVALSLFKILRLIRQQRIDLIHGASAPRMLLVAAILALFSRAKLVVHVHEEPRSRRLLQTSLVHFGLRRADAIITVSNFMKQRVVTLGIESAKVWPILNRVNLQRFHPNNDGGEIHREYGIGPQTRLIVTIGRIYPPKGQMELLKALVMVKQVFPEVKTLLVGWDARTRMPSGRTYQQELEEFCIQQGLADNVIFTGPRADIPKVFAATDMVVVPSIFDDPCPLVVLEAMATGKPVIGTLSGGIPEELGESSGILVPRGKPKELAEAIIRLLQQPQLREELGRAARKRAEEQFYERRLAEEVEVVYASILN